MAAKIFSQSGAELRIQDSGTHARESPCWKQPTSFNGELGLVSRISMATRIELIDYIQYGENLRKSGAPSTMTVGSEKEKWIRVILYKTGRKAGRDGNIIRNQSETRLTSWLPGPLLARKALNPERLSGAETIHWEPRSFSQSTQGLKLSCITSHPMCIRSLTCWWMARVWM